MLLQLNSETHPIKGKFFHGINKTENDFSSTLEKLKTKIKLGQYLINIVTMICRNDDLSLTELDCLQIDLEDFILFAEINQILLKTSHNYYL